MLKWARRIIVFLLLGAIVNVAVAWGCAALNAHHLQRSLRLDQLRRRAVSNDSDPLYIDSLVRFGFERVIDGSFSRMVKTPLTEQTKTPEYNRSIWWDAEKVNFLDGVQFATGWPAFSFRAWQELRLDPRESTDPPTMAGTFRDHWIGAFEFSSQGNANGGSDRIVIPVKVLPYGFAMNTAFYGAVLLLLANAGPMMRSCIRAKRGLCPACGYPRGTSPVCTECGEALPC